MVNNCNNYGITHYKIIQIGVILYNKDILFRHDDYNMWLQI